MCTSQLENSAEIDSVMLNVSDFSSESFHNLFFFNTYQKPIVYVHSLSLQGK